MKDAARDVQEEDQQNTQGKRTKPVAPKRATKKQKPEAVIPASQPSQPVQGQSSGSKPQEIVAEPAKVEVKDPNSGNKPEEVGAEPAKVEVEVKAPIKKRGQVSPEDLLELWKTKEP